MSGLFDNQVLKLLFGSSAVFIYDEIFAHVGRAVA
jgi:hypothetical protein